MNSGLTTWVAYAVSVLAMLFVPVLCRADIWPPAPADLFHADQYATPSAAAEAAGARAATIIQSQLVEAGTTPVIHLTGDHDETVVRVRRAIERVLPGSVTASSQASKDGYLVQIRTADDAIDLTITTPTQTISESLHVTNQTWVDEPTRGVVVRTNEPGATPSEAEQIVLGQALEQLVPMAMKEIAPVHRARVMRAVREQIASDLARGDMTADTFTCRLSRPYGDVYYTALLLDVPTERMDGWQSLAQQAQDAEAVRRIGSRVGPVVLVSVLLLLYAGVNTITRGYFTTRLRVAVVMLAVVGVWLMVRLA